MILKLQLLLPFAKLRDFTVNGGEEWCRNTFQGHWEYNFDYDRLYIENEFDLMRFLERWT